ncbi:S1C family serine protease [Limimaricola pyoseonensis]|uniref:Serine protease, S1-C subfamily, contains C-terminal PDZ domain n=1 Tax=Limimaricola pyoseonensis TaxID=521013 RepID=A0A1G7CTL0_9RHOB|nr:trypsin-like peptidase domain-containing protein [Limimaricola pyoseonensis]SDE42637.1 serine protease, S1-C subfamily, contains C-terminal PDZ domain [Limimaricola pyoseonensis]
MRAILTGVVLGLMLLGAFQIGRLAAPEPPPPAPLPPGPESLELPESRTIAVFRAARDSVVAITTSARVAHPFTRRAAEMPLGTGSGFLWDRDGHVVTNDHVIREADSAMVQLADGRSLPARVVGRDPSHDLAVLRIEGGDLPAPLPRPEAGEGALEVGQSVLAIGNPFGLDWTLTTGIVSALERELDNPRGATIRGLIQTDAAINPGNSGGPLLDSRGRLVGVNTAIYSPSGTSTGIGFAVPVSTVSRVVPQLIETGRYVPPSLGMGFDARINAAVNRQGLSGVVVLDVARGSEAARAGVEPARVGRGSIVPGDVIVGIDGAPVATLDELMAEIDRRRVGEEVTVTLERDGARREVALTLRAGR